MKKRNKPEPDEMVSLNQQLFSLDAGNLTVEELDRRLELAIAGLPTLDFNCGEFSCVSYAACASLSCGRFRAYGI
ncbi:MAG: hypothetical protein M3O15_08680 [Acidobacteriota bacterium]|nr:hypothetical protein [Acidobacteriota bacterium]